MWVLGDHYNVHTSHGSCSLIERLRSTDTGDNALFHFSGCASSFLDESFNINIAKMENVAQIFIDCSKKKTQMSLSVKGVGFEIQWSSPRRFDILLTALTELSFIVNEVALPFSKISFLRTPRGQNLVKKIHSAVQKILCSFMAEKNK